MQFPGYDFGLVHSALHIYMILSFTDEDDKVLVFQLRKSPGPLKRVSILGMSRQLYVHKYCAEVAHTPSS